MKRRILLKSSLMLVLLCAGLLHTRTAHAVSDSIYTSPASQTILDGSTFSVAVHEDSGMDAINGVQANLNYPSSLLKVVSVNVGSGWSQAQNDTSTAGTILFAAFPSPTGTTLTGDQVFETVVFQAIAAGTVGLSFGCNQNSGSCPNGNALTRASDSTDILTSTAGSSITVNYDHLVSGQTMLAGQYLISPNVLYRLSMQADGNFVLYGANLNPIWSSNTHGSGANRAIMQSDGNLVLYTAGNKAVWSSRSGGVGQSSLILQDDGNLVLYKTTWEATWSTGTGGHQQFNYFGSDRLTDNQTLHQNQYIKSADGRYAALLQSDGNLVLYSAGYHVLWASATGGSAATSLVMQSDGNLVLYTAGNKAVWSSRSGGVGQSSAIVQTDGNFVTYKANYSPTWASNTSGAF